MPAHFPPNPAGLQPPLTAWHNPAAPAAAAATPSFIALIDIGQGSLSAVFNGLGQPYLYYDFGGGACFGQSTYPGELRLCAQMANIWVVLSHWDWDHWRNGVPAVGAGGAAGIVANPLAAVAQNATWLVPNQPKGVQHNAFEQKLEAVTMVRKRTVAVAHNGVHLLLPHIRILKCNGAERNHNGLALEVTFPDAGAPVILMTGDAYFNHSQHAAGANLVGIVASHHGAEDGTVGANAAAGAPNAVVGYSFGAGIDYGHPRGTLAVNPYTGAGYVTRLHTSGRSACHPQYGGRGNVALRVPGGALGPAIAPPLGAPPAAVTAAAVALLASAAAAAWASNPAWAAGAAARAGVIAAAAACRIATAPVRALYTQPMGGPGDDVGIALAGAGAPEPWLTAAYAQMNTADARLTADANVALHLATCIAEAYVALALHVEGLAAAASPPPGAVGGHHGRAARARDAAEAHTNDSPAQIAVANAVVACASLAPLHALLAVAPGAPAAVDIARAIALIVCRIAYDVVGKSHGPVVGAKHAHVAAADAALAWPIAPDAATGWAPLGPGDPRFLAGICAGAGVMPAIELAPEILPTALAAAHVPQALAPIHVSVAAALADHAAGAGPADTVRAAVAAARAAFAARHGAPQIGCHRYPSSCGAGNVCQMTIHYSDSSP